MNVFTTKSFLLTSFGVRFASQLPPKLQKIGCRQREIANTFQKFALENSWREIRNAWASERIFPDPKMLTASEVTQLSGDSDFSNAHSKTLQLVAKTWGFDCKKGEFMYGQLGTQIWGQPEKSDATVEQQVFRLKSMIESSKSFGPQELHQNLMKFSQYEGIQLSIKETEVNSKV